VQGVANVSKQNTLGIARDFLQMDEPWLDSASLQIRTLCEQDLLAISTTGRLGPNTKLAKILEMITHMMAADTQAIEGLNSLVRMISVRCRKISLELLASRVCIKYHLSYQPENIQDTLTKSNTTSHNRKKLQDGEQLLKAILPHKFAFRDDCDLDRWAPPALALLNVADDQLVEAHSYLKIEDSDLWSSSYAAAVRKIAFPRRSKKKSETHGDSERLQGRLQIWTSEPGLRLIAVSIQNLLDKSEDVVWFLYISKFRYTLCFLPLLPVGSDLIMRIPYDFLDLNKIFREQRDHAKDAKLCVKVFSVQVKPADICFESMSISHHQQQAIDAVQSMAHASAEGTNCILVCRIPNLHDPSTFLFELNADLHPSCPKTKTTSSKRKPKIAKPEDDLESGSGAEDEAEHVALELQGGVFFSGSESDNGNLTHQSDHDAIAKREVDAIKKAVKEKTCPPETAIHQLTETMANLPEFSALSKHELQEEALLTIIKGLDAPEGGTEQSGAGANVGASGTTYTEDAALSGPTSVFRECRASKASGPASVPAGKDFCKHRHIHLKSSAKDAFTLWHDEMVISFKALASKSDMQSITGERENISLVLVGTMEPPESDQQEKPCDDNSADLFDVGSCEVMWVHWVRHKVNVARQVNLDQNGRVIFSMAFAFPEIDLNKQSWRMIMEDCSVPMMKVRQSERPVVPEHFIRMSDICEQIVRQCISKARFSKFAFTFECNIM
jgi:hypothetical protein